ncbi:hypothetical protein E4U57_002856 [Claviceps arundinis]|uniref:Uncharacterized protein n=1 Tax=Claviceps arundinis TaxID=1623583 RepID=A0ABQ7PLW8_9HYPO|nr:hypothetical protein E4U57_002856 [Claviceps arundinis]
MSRKVLVNAGDGGEFGGEAEAAPPERSSCPAFGLLEAGGWRPCQGSGELEMVESSWEFVLPVQSYRGSSCLQLSPNSQAVNYQTFGCRRLALCRDSAPFPQPKHRFF